MKKYSGFICLKFDKHIAIGQKIIFDFLSVKIILSSYVGEVQHPECSSQQLH